MTLYYKVTLSVAAKKTFYVGVEEPAQDEDGEPLDPVLDEDIIVSLGAENAARLAEEFNRRGVWADRYEERVTSADAEIAGE